ncbi:hypothetical protein [Gordonia sp. CPCC 205333]|uniref:hypothetical protein n=1 Tax=Gordonia sp. CPCC 205333 TaxID=3140790 RepID=UPI003AF38663
MLWYLNLAAVAGVVTTHKDSAHGVMVQDSTGGGQVESVTLIPCVTVTTSSDPDIAREVHVKIPRCASSPAPSTSPRRHEPVITVKENVSLKGSGRLGGVDAVV